MHYVAFIGKRYSIPSQLNPESLPVYLLRRARKL